jgi:hypothetical protein
VDERATGRPISRAGSSRSPRAPSGSSRRPRTTPRWS